MSPSRGAAEKRYDGQVAVVTGVSSGFGRRVASDLAARGATVFGLARRAGPLDELDVELKKLSPDSATRVCDVADATAFRSALTAVETEGGRIDVLVNNAGVEQLTPAAAGDDAGYRHIMEVNYFGVVTGTLAVLPGMVRRGSGIVVNVSSDSARAPEAGHGAYSASKAAVAAFTEAVAHEMAAHGVHVHVLYPAWMPTAMGLSGLDDGGSLPPKAVRRTEAQVSALLLERMGGRRMEINAAFLPQLAALGRVVAPVPYQKAMMRRAAGRPDNRPGSTDDA